MELFQLLLLLIFAGINMCEIIKTEHCFCVPASQCLNEKIFNNNSEVIPSIR